LLFCLELDWLGAAVTANVRWEPQEMEAMHPVEVLKAISKDSMELATPTTP
jgi:hypothetical protein